MSTPPRRWIFSTTGARSCLTEDKTYCYDYRFVDLPNGNYQIVEDETM